jgi:hypothetical protein
MLVFFICTGGGGRQVPFRRVNVICVDFDSFALIFHLFSHVSMCIRCSCKLEGAVVGLS